MKLSSILYCNHLPEIISNDRSIREKSLRLNKKIQEFRIGDLILSIMLGSSSRSTHALISVRSPSQRGLRIFNFLKRRDPPPSPNVKWIPYELTRGDTNIFGKYIDSQSFLLVTDTDGDPIATVEVVPGIKNRIVNCSLEIKEYQDAEFTTPIWGKT